MIEFKMPSLGSDMDEGTLNEWLVKPGDTVSRGQVVAVVERAGRVDTLFVGKLADAAGVTDRAVGTPGERRVSRP